jgi:hypothetical protein
MVTKLFLELLVMQAKSLATHALVWHLPTSSSA